MTIPVDMSARPSSDSSPREAFPRRRGAVRQVVDENSREVWMKFNIASVLSLVRDNRDTRTPRLRQASLLIRRSFVSLLKREKNEARRLQRIRDFSRRGVYRPREGNRFKSGIDAAQLAVLSW
jgi:hypothetical protein